MPYPRSAAAIEVELATIAAAYPALCTRTMLDNQTHEGNDVSVLKIAKGTGPRRVVVLTGGVHAREWAPPDALVSLAGRLLGAYDAGTSLTIPAHTDAISVPSVTYPESQIPDDDVRRIVERLDLHIVALVNPDGRATSQMRPENALWRKNRRPAPANHPTCRGADINRNYPFPGDFQVYYSAAAEPAVAASKSPCDFQGYVGPSPGSEPETQNVMGLLTAGPVDFFVDVHSFARKILHPWGVDGLQDTKKDLNWRNTEWDRGGAKNGRDGKRGGAYDEFFPNDEPSRLLDAHRLIAGLMRDAILQAAGGDERARKRSRYEVGPSADLYPAPGLGADWAFSRNFPPGTPPGTLARPVHALIIESGSEENLEGGFQPPVQAFPKIEREIQLALLALLSHAASLPPP